MNEAADVSNDPTASPPHYFTITLAHYRTIAPSHHSTITPPHYRTTAPSKRRLPYLRTFPAILLLLVGCGPMTDPAMRVGGLYSVHDGTGGYRAAKLLAFDSTVVHLRLYSNRYSVRPDTILSGTLRLDPLEGELAGREHFAVARHIFRAWNPMSAGFDSVTASELKLMDDWKRSGGNVVGRE